MASVTGHVSDDMKEYIEEELVENGPYDSKSEAVEAALDYFIYNKYGDET